MSLQSTFESLPLDELLLLLASTSQTGVLHFAGYQPCDVWVADGHVVAVHRAEDASLGDALVSGGAVSADAWAELSADGEVDLAAFAARPEVDGELVAAIVHDRIVEGLFPLLLVPEASYVFEAGVEPPNGAFVRIDGDRAIEEARQRLDDWTAIARTVRSLDTVVALATALPSGSSDAVVTAAEWPVLARADGNRTLGELVRVTGMSAFAVCSAVHRLVGRGLLVALDA